MYRKRIGDMCVNNRRSLEVSYLHLAGLEPTMAIWVAAPAEMLTVPRAAKTETLKLYPSCESIHKHVFVRLMDVPVKDQIRDIGSTTSSNQGGGVVTKRTGVFPQLQEAYYTCGQCGFLAGPMMCKTARRSRSPGRAWVPVEGAGWVSRRRPSTQLPAVTLQESPGNVPAGRLQNKEVILLNDLIDQIRPGDEVEVTGVFTTDFEGGLNIRF